MRTGKGPYGANVYDIPGVKLTQGGRQTVTVGAPDTDAGGAPQVTPNPSLTVPKDKEELFKLIKDYHKGVTHKDEHGKAYKISPSTRERIYVEV